MQPRHLCLVALPAALGLACLGAAPEAAFTPEEHLLPAAPQDAPPPTTTTDLSNVTLDERRLRVHFIDIGPGLAALIETPSLGYSRVVVAPSAKGREAADDAHEERIRLHVGCGQRVMCADSSSRPPDSASGTRGGLGALASVAAKCVGASVPSGERDDSRRRPSPQVFPGVAGRHGDDDAPGTLGDRRPDLHQPQS